MTGLLTLRRCATSTICSSSPSRHTGGQTILAQWVVRAFPTSYKLEEPLPQPADFVLRSAKFQVVVVRAGWEHHYACLLRDLRPSRT